MSAAAGLASIGAGTIHVAAAAAHRDHAEAMAGFAILAAFQLLWGAIALRHSGRRVLVAGVLGNLVAVVGWIAAKTVGIAAVPGLEHAEPAQLADSLAAALAALAVTCAVAAIAGARAGGPRSALGPVLSGALGVAVAVAAIAGVSAAPGHTHHEAHASEHDARASPHGHPSARRARGGDGVSAAQQARADRLERVTRRLLPRFADVSTAKARGYRSIGDAPTGYEHLINWSSINDDKLLDPRHAESLVYRVSGTGRRTLVAAMYMLRERDTLETVPDVGGRLTQWHVHGDLCFTDDPTAPRVAGITTPGGNCPAPLVRRARVPMLHVWIVPHECGPFASLEGIGAGQVREGEQRRCDRSHGKH